MTEGNETPTKSRPIWPWIVVAVIIAGVVWFNVTISNDDDYKDAAEAACLDEVTARYGGQDVDVIVDYKARTGDRLEYTAVDTLAEFHWDCAVTGGADDMNVSVSKS